MSRAGRLTSGVVMAAATLLALTAGGPVEAAGRADATDGPAEGRGGRTCVSHFDGSLWPAISAQNFEPQFDQYDSEVADDFAVDRRCRARSLRVEVDTFSGVGIAESARVAFFRDGGDRPGRVIWEQQVEAVGDFTELTMPIDPPLRLRPGRDYWVALQLDLDFATGGQIAVSARNYGTGSPVVWRNPGDGFETGCTVWTPAIECSEQWGGRLAIEITNRFDPRRPDREEHR